MTIRLAHFTDIHLTAAPATVPWRSLLSKRFLGWVNLKFFGRYSHLSDAARICTAFLKDLESQQPDHVLFTGDVTGLSLVQEFEEARALLAPLFGDGRVTGIPGNHDVYTHASAKDKLFENYFGEWERSDWPSAPPTVRLLGDSVALICLRDARARAFHDSSGEVGEEQLSRLAKILADSRLSGRRRVLALHYGPRRADGRPDSRHHGLRDADRVLEVARQGQVDLILHGHLHNRFTLPPGQGTPVAIANAGSLTHSANDRAYHIYQISRDHIALEVRRFEDTLSSFVSCPESSGVVLV